MSKKKEQPVLFQEGSRYILVTPKSPNGFKGLLFMAWEGETPDSLTEVVKTASDLQALANCRIELTSIPTEWQVAFAKVANLSLPEPAAEPTAIKPTAEPAAAPIALPIAESDPFARMGPLCVTWVWAFGIATLIAMLLGVIK